MSGTKAAALVCFVLVAFGVIGGMAGNSEAIFPTVVFGIAGTVLFLQKPKAQKKAADDRKRAELMRIKPEEKQIRGLHQAGLPLAVNTECLITYGDDRITFQGGGNVFQLSPDRITDICMKSEEELRTQYVSSVGGALIGAALFGPLGAMVGGRVREKTKSEYSFFLIFTYRKGNAVEYISFELIPSKKPPYDRFTVLKWIEDFQKRYSESRFKTIDL